MAETKTAAPAASTASKAAAPVAPKKNGFDPLRPVRYLAGFTKGTWNGTLDGMSNWGRRGMWIGTAIGVLAMITLGGGLAMVAAGWIAGLAGGAVAGGAVGLATGGARGVGRESRRDKYSEDLMRKARAASMRPGPQVDYRAAHREHRQQNDTVLDRIFRQQREIAEQTRDTFRDMVGSSRGGGMTRW